MTWAGRLGRGEGAPRSSPATAGASDSAAPAAAWPGITLLPSCPSCAFPLLLVHWPGKSEAFFFFFFLPGCTPARVAAAQSCRGPPGPPPCQGAPCPPRRAPAQSCSLTLPQQKTLCCCQSVPCQFSKVRQLRAKSRSRPGAVPRGPGRASLQRPGSGRRGAAGWEGRYAAVVSGSGRRAALHEQKVIIFLPDQLPDPVRRAATLCRRNGEDVGER